MGIVMVQLKEFFERGEIIFELNAPARHIYILKKGEISVQDGNSPLVQLGTIHEGESFGESALLLGGKRLATVRCETEVIVHTYDSDQIKALFKKWKGGTLTFQCLLIEMLNANEGVKKRSLNGEADDKRPAALEDLVSNAISSFSAVTEIVRDSKQLHGGWKKKEAFLVTGGHAIIRKGKDFVEIGTDTCLGASQLILGNDPSTTIEIESIRQPLAGWFIPVAAYYEKLKQLNVGLAAVARGIAHKTARSDTTS